MISVRPLTDPDRPWVRERVAAWWASEVVVVHDGVFRPAELDGFVAELDGEPVGLLTFVVEGESCEIVSLAAEVRGRGVGTALLDAAAALGCRSLRVTTTNDNEEALGFYRRRGFRVVAVHEGAVDRARRTKPEIPTHDARGVPISDEVDMELLLP